MSKVSLKKIFIGLLFISFSFVILIYAFYYFKVKPTLEERHKARLAIKKAKTEEEIPSYNYKEEIITDVEEKEEQKPAKTQVEVQKINSSDKEQTSTEGFLWIDRQASKYVVTLGAASGLSTGSKLDVYDGNDNIGEVVVATPFDVISYVTLSPELSNKLNKDYYKVLIK